MNHTSSVACILLALAIPLVAILTTTAVVHAQQLSSSSLPSKAPHITKIKISSPIKGQEVPVGKDLTVSGRSIDNAAASTNDCKVSVSINKVRPYQLATPTAAIGTGSPGSAGATDYSKWNFVLTSKYTTIKPGPNRITAKYECVNNPSLTSYSSVNVTGVQASISTTTTTPAPVSLVGTPSQKPVAAASGSSPKQQEEQQIVNANNNNHSNAVSRSSTTTVAQLSNASNISSALAPQMNAANQQQQQELQQQILAVNNGTAGPNSTLVSSSPMVVPDNIMYLGYHAGITTDNSLKDKSSTDTKSSDHHTDGSKSSSKTASQSKQNMHHDNNGGSKEKKSSSKGHNNDKRSDAGDEYD